MSNLIANFGIIIYKYWHLFNKFGQSYDSLTLNNRKTLSSLEQKEYMLFNPYSLFILG